MDITLDILKAYGPSGVLAILIWVMLQKSEAREAKKDIRIQSLEDQLRESFDERIIAADQLSDALHNNADAMDKLVSEIRSNNYVKRN